MSELLFQLAARNAQLHAGPVISPALSAQAGRSADTENIHRIRLKSTLLSGFFGRDVFMNAGVVVPADRKAGETAHVRVGLARFSIRPPARF